MTTTANAVASEGLTSPASQTARHPAQGRGWVYAGIGAGLAGTAALVGSSLTDAVYQEEIAGDGSRTCSRPGASCRRSPHRACCSSRWHR